MSDSGRLSVKMRASAAGKHVSGAEKIVPRAAVPGTVSALVERALSHPKGRPDFVNVKVETVDGIRRLRSLPVTTYPCATAAEGCARAAELLRAAGIARIDDIRALAALGPDKIEGAICGRALYEGAFTLEEALAASRGEE